MRFVSVIRPVPVRVITLCRLNRPKMMVVLVLENSLVAGKSKFNRKFRLIRWGQPRCEPYFGTVSGRRQGRFFKF